MLPFVVAPQEFETVRVGSEQDGILEIKKLYDISALERRYIRAAGLLDIQKTIAALARKISKETGTGFVYAYDRVASYVFSKGAVVGDTVKVSGKEGVVISLDEINDDSETTLLSVEIGKKLVSIAASELELIEPDWATEYAIAIESLVADILSFLEQKKLTYVTAVLKYRVQADWTEEDTLNPMMIKPGLLEAIYEFTQSEEKGWKEDETPTLPTETTEEELGKS